MNLIRYIISIFLTPLFYLIFISNLLFFDIVQRVSFLLGGYKFHKFVIDIFCFFLMQCLSVLGIFFKKSISSELPKKRTPLIIVSNHQGLYDIPPLFWYFRKYHPKFVSKIELGKGLPSISYNLRKGGSVLINRKDPRSSLLALTNFAKKNERKQHSAVIFPEGTRSKRGIPKKFSENGLKTLIKYMPSALIVPVTINNSWKIFSNGYFPLPLWFTITFQIHKSLDPKTMSFEELFEKTEKIINSGVIHK